MNDLLVLTLLKTGKDLLKLKHLLSCGNKTGFLILPGPDRGGSKAFTHHDAAYTMFYCE